jgi:hypothetical protein
MLPSSATLILLALAIPLQCNPTQEVTDARKPLPIMDSQDSRRKPIQRDNRKFRIFVDNGHVQCGVQILSQTQEQFICRQENGLWNLSDKDVGTLSHVILDGESTMCIMGIYFVCRDGIKESPWYTVGNPSITKRLRSFELNGMYVEARITIDGNASHVKAYRVSMEALKEGWERAPLNENDLEDREDDGDTKSENGLDREKQKGDEQNKDGESELDQEEEEDQLGSEEDEEETEDDQLESEEDEEEREDGKGKEKNQGGKNNKQEAKSMEQKRVQNDILIT